MRVSINNEGKITQLGKLAAREVLFGPFWKCFVMDCFNKKGVVDIVEMDYVGDVKT